VQGGSVVFWDDSRQAKKVKLGEGETQQQVERVAAEPPVAILPIANAELKVA
jgi:hypothetical protein